MAEGYRSKQQVDYLLTRLDGVPQSQVDTWLAQSEQK